MLTHKSSTSDLTKGEACFRDGRYPTQATKLLCFPKKKLGAY
jgi:hypothetical protein